MDNRIGNNVTQYRNVIIRASEIGDCAVLGDDVFLTDSVIGKRCRIERRGMVFNSVIGDYSYTGYNTVVKHAEIGKFCSIAWNCSLGGADHDYKRLTMHPFPLYTKYGITEVQEEYDSFEDELIIGNDVWIAANVCITRGLKIGNGAVIGAGSVVTKDIPPFAIVYGNPAKIHGYRFDEDTIKAVEKLEWWDWPEDKLRDNVELFRGQVGEQTIRAILEDKSGR